ncbi:MAG: PAS domain-containing protein [Gammaproteobacteria bacterium]
MDGSKVVRKGQSDDKFVAEMRERVQLLEMAESLAAVGHWQIDLRAGKLFWSDEIYRIHGLSPETYTPDISSAIDFYHPDDAPRVAALVDSAISDKRPFEFDVRLLRPDGAIRHVRSRGRITLSDSGEVETVFGVFQDITDTLETKEALEESQLRFDLAVRGSNAGLWYWQIQTGELFWSPRCMEVVGLDPVQYKPTFEDFEDRIHPQDKEAVAAALNAHLEHRVPYDVEFRQRRTDHTYVWIHSRGQAEWDQSGKPVRMAGSVEEIDVRKRHESFREAVYAALTTSNVHVDDKISQMLQLGCDYLNLDKGTICRHSDGRISSEYESGDDNEQNELENVAVRFTPYVIEADALTTHSDLTPDQRATAGQKKHGGGRVHYVGAPLTVNGRVYGSVSFASRSVARRQFASYETAFVPVLVRLLAYELSQRETLSRAMSANRDVERQQAELDRILNIVPVRIWYKDKNNRILRLNEKAAKSMNMTVADAEGADTYELFPAMARKYHEDDLRVIDSGEAEYGIVEQYTPRDGPRGWISTDKIPFNDDESGEPRLLVVSQDISPMMRAQRDLERQAQELRQTNHDLDHFAYIASHDLRAPMRGIDQLATWIEEDLGDRLDDDVQSKLRLMRKRVGRMDKMLSDILTFARAGKREHTDEGLDVRRVLHGVVEWLAPNEGIDISIEIDALTLLMSRTQFEQLFLNLIGNAIAHHDRAVGTITVEAEVDPNRVVFIVRDDGPGIPVNYQEKVFEMFSTLKRRDEREGSGIGLAVIQRIARAHGGSVTLNSPLTDRGTEFRVSFPASMVSSDVKIDSVS